MLCILLVFYLIHRHITSSTCKQFLVKRNERVSEQQKVLRCLVIWCHRPRRTSFDNIEIVKLSRFAFSCEERVIVRPYVLFLLFNSPLFCFTRGVVQSVWIKIYANSGWEIETRSCSVPWYKMPMEWGWKHGLRPLTLWEGRKSAEDSLSATKKKQLSQCVVDMLSVCTFHPRIMLKQASVKNVCAWILWEGIFHH